MNLAFDISLSERYKSKSQIARVLTEEWVDRNIFCPNCGNSLMNYENNKPVADFFCRKCSEDYELKSKKNSIGKKIVDGAYSTMIERLDSSQNPNFFFLNYDAKTLHVNNFIVIPKHFFTPQVIEKRKPLAQNAKRAGWVGCNILLNEIPQSGRIFFVRDGQVEPKNKILDEWNRTLFLRESKIEQKGWLLDIMMCIEKLGKQDFNLKELYTFTPYLKSKYPKNNFVEDKIRQQLQLLRDKGFLSFTSRGNYKVI